MSYTRNVMVLYRYATLGAVAGRSRTDSTREVGFLERTTLILFLFAFDANLNRFGRFATFQGREHSFDRLG